MLCAFAAGCSGFKVAERSPGVRGGSGNPEFELPIVPGSAVRVHLKAGGFVEGNLVAVTAANIEIVARAPADTVISIPLVDVVQWETPSGDPALLISTYFILVVSVIGYALRHGGLF